MPTQIKTQDVINAAITAPKLNVLTTRGDLLTYDGGHSRLPVGSHGQVLTSQGGGLAWANRLLYVNTTVPLGNTVTSTTETAFATTCQVPALNVGDVLRVQLRGTYVSTAPSPTLTVRVKLGATVIVSAAVAAGVKPAGVWTADVSSVVQGVTLDSNVRLEMNATTIAASTIPLPSSTTLSVTAQWSLINSITLRQFIVELVR